MKWNNKPNIYFLNLLFLFYVGLGPVKALSYYLFDSNHSTLLQINYFVKARVSKKYIPSHSSNVHSKVQTEKLTDGNPLIDYNHNRYTIFLFVRSLRSYCDRFLIFSNVPIHILYCNFRL